MEADRSDTVSGLKNGAEIARQRKLALKWMLVFSVMLVAMEFMQKAEAQQNPYRWITSPTVSFYETPGFPSGVSAAEWESAIKYAAWSWGTRTGIGAPEFLGEGIFGPQGHINIRIATPIEYILNGGKADQGAVTKWSFYTNTAWMYSANILLNGAYFDGPVIDRCEMLTLVHEFGHAMGVIGHSSDGNDVMALRRDHCRYALTGADVEWIDMFNSDQTCYAELTRENDIYIQGLDGFRVMLAAISDDIWQLVYLEPTDDLYCPVATLDANLNLHIDSVQRPGVDLEADFEYIGNSQWRLVSVENN